MVTTERTPNNTLLHRCARCTRSFPHYKSLVRHMQTVCQPSERYICDRCNDSFARRDVLLRHKLTQHTDSGQVIECDICHREVRRRSLPEHQNSRYCRRVRSNNARERDLVPFPEVQKRHAASPSPLGPLPVIVEAVLLSAKLFIRLKPWGPGQQTFERFTLQSREQSIEVRELKSTLFRAVINELDTDHSMLSKNTNLVDAITMLLLVTSLTDGFDDTTIHNKGLVQLVTMQHTAHPGMIDTHINRKSSSAFHDALLQDTNNQVIPSTEFEKIYKLITTLLSLIRRMSYDIIYQPIKHKERNVLDRVARLTYEEWVSQYQQEVMDVIGFAQTIEKPEEDSIPQPRQYRL